MGEKINTYTRFKVVRLIKCSSQFVTAIRNEVVTIKLLLWHRSLFYPYMSRTTMQMGALVKYSLNHWMKKFL